MLTMQLDVHGKGTGRRLFGTMWSHQPTWHLKGDGDVDRKKDKAK